MKKRFPIRESAAIDTLIRQTERNWYKGGVVPHFLEHEGVENIFDRFHLNDDGMVDLDRFSFCAQVGDNECGNWSHKAVTFCPPEVFEMPHDADRRKHYEVWMREKQDKKAAARVKKEDLTRMAETQAWLEARREEEARISKRNESYYMARELQERLRQQAEIEAQNVALKGLPFNHNWLTLHEIRFVVRVNGAIMNVEWGDAPVGEYGRGITTNGAKVCVLGGVSHKGWLK